MATDVFPINGNVEEKICMILSLSCFLLRRTRLLRTSPGGRNGDLFIQGIRNEGISILRGWEG